MHYELPDWIDGLRALLLLAAFAGFAWALLASRRDTVNFSRPEPVERRVVFSSTDVSVIVSNLCCVWIGPLRRLPEGAVGLRAGRRG